MQGIGAGTYDATARPTPDAGTSAAVYSGDELPRQKTTTISDKVGLYTNIGDTTLPGEYGFGREDTTPVKPNTGKSAADKRTERLARAADRINNRLYMAGYEYHFMPGAGLGGSVTTKDARDISKEIETEDQRQQALNRTLLANKRAYAELELIKDVNQFVRDIDKLKLQGNIKAAQDLFAAKVDKALANNDKRGMLALQQAGLRAGLSIDDARRMALSATYNNYGHTLDNLLLMREMGITGIAPTMNPYQQRAALKTEDREGGMYIAGQNSLVNPMRKSSAVGSSSER